ncbi:MAG: tetratricopeptide repeat protein [Verrucomicrobia bacterium]|nr:tetratricopeptide repeat protein [Verrucomicrobiota bacterium]
MNFRLFILLLIAPALFAQEMTSTRPIEAALQDELYPLAEEQVWNALSIQQPVEEKTDLTILLIRSLIGQKRFDDAVILADESAHLLKQDAFIYWKARAFFDAGNFEAVFQTLEKDKKLLSDGPYAPAALRLKGRAEQAIGERKDAEDSFDRFRKQFANDDDAPQNLLDLANIQLERKREKAAVKTLHELLERFPDSVLADSVRLLLARELITAGGKDKQAEASALLAQLGASETAPARLRIAAWVELAALEQRGGRSAVAADALLKAETLTGETALRVRQKAARANLLIDEGKNQEALSLFDEAMQAAPDNSLAANILLQKAEALLKTDQFSSAENAFQSYLDVTADPTGEAQALFGKGWSLWEQTRFEEAAAAFERAAAKTTDPDRCATAWVKAGDARLAAKQAGAATKNYRQISDNFATHPLAARAMYQAGVALLSADKQEAGRAFTQVESGFPQSEFAPRAALQLAGLLKSEKKWDAALEEYQRIAGQYTNAAAQATALHQQGLILFGFDRFAEALENFRAVSDTYPDSPEAPQAYYMRGFCRYLQGDIEEALVICRTFIEKYPASLWTPEVLFWLGEHAYNRGNYPQAQTTFLDIVARFPQNALADEALLWAANALLEQDSYLDAFTLYSRLAKEYPASPLLLQARFAQGEALTELGEFPRAILAYEEIIKAAPDLPLADRARGRLGDCLFTLGTTEATRYQEAMDAYQALYKRPATPFALKLQALYKIARCEDKTGQPEKAFAHYMEVVYQGGSSAEALSPEAVLWFTRAALEAAAQQEQQARWNEAVNIYERIIQAGVPAQDEAVRRIEKIKKENAGAF